MRLRRKCQWVAGCAAGAMLFQTGGCAGLDTTGLITQILTLTINAILQSLLGSLTV